MFCKVFLVVWVTFLQNVLMVSSMQNPQPSRRSPHELAPRGGGAEATSDDDDVKDGRMPSLFAPEEAHYDRYAACLAATEGLRRIRDKALSDEGVGRRFGRLGSPTEQTEAQKRISAEYVVNSGKVLKALGMSVTQFNQLGRQVGQNDNLKEKVMEQAYLYRMAATLNLQRIPLVEDPASEQLLKATRRKRMEMFCDSMTEIEQLRADQMERLKKSLRVDKLPPGISLSDPSIKPFLNPKVRAVVEAFPLQAEEIVKKHGLHSDEFNQMLEETKNNPVFRWQVESEIKKEKDGKDKVKAKEAKP